MKSNQVSAIPDIVKHRNWILQIQIEIWSVKTETIQIKFWISNMKNDTIKINTQILNIKSGTIKLKSQLTYTKTLQMALNTDDWTFMILHRGKILSDVFSTWSTETDLQPVGSLHLILKPPLSSGVGVYWPEGSSSESSVLNIAAGKSLFSISKDYSIIGFEHLIDQWPID